jgi:hypothetical protein
MKELIVIAGPANSGKYPLAKRLLDEDPRRLLVHRDPIRVALSNPCDEGDITTLMGGMAAVLLEQGYSVIACAWNLEPVDFLMWTEVAKLSRVPCRWLDTRNPEVQALIPPLEPSA